MHTFNLRGTGVALVTPFDNHQQIDFTALEKLIDYNINGGVDYLVILGTTGETPTLSLEEKKTIIQFTFQINKNRVPIMIGVGGNHTAAVVKELNELPLEQAAAILSTAPYYNKPTQDGLFEHYKTIAENSPKPVLLYNVPGRTSKNMEAATTLKLAHNVPNILGIKEASENMMQAMTILKNRPKDFLVVSGSDDLVMAQIACGMDGVISVIANAFPYSFSTLIKAALKGDFKTAQSWQNDLLEVYNLLFVENNPAGVKCFLHQFGIIQNHLRLPLTPASAALEEKIKSFITHWQHPLF